MTHTDTIPARPLRRPKNAAGARYRSPKTSRRPASAGESRIGRTGRRLALSAILTAAVALPAGAQVTPRHDSGVLTVRQRGQVLGQEQFQLHNGAAGGSLQARLRYRLGGRSVQQDAVLHWLAGGRLAGYWWRQGGERITVRMRGPRLQADYQPARGPAQTFQFQLAATTAILDANVYSLWEPLADRYVLARGGTQTFSVFVPHSGNPGQVRLTLLPAAPKSRASGLERLRAETGQATVYLVLRNGRLLRLSLPADGVVVTRDR